MFRKPLFTKVPTNDFNLINLVYYTYYLLLTIYLVKLSNVIPSIIITVDKHNLVISCVTMATANQVQYVTRHQLIIDLVTMATPQ